MTRNYRSELREEQAAATRERILDAAHVLLGTTRPVDLAWAAVAAHARVSVRTVYRHFPRPEDLFLALSDRLMGQIFGPSMQQPTTLAEGAEVLRRQFELLEEDPALFRLFFAVPTRSRRADGQLERLFASQLAGVPAAQRPLAVGLLDLLCSPYAWDVLHAYYGADGAQAHRAVLVGVRATLDYLSEHPDALDPDGPDPDLEDR